MPLNNAQKSVIHVAKNQLGWDEATYRDVLKNHGGAASSKDLSYAGFKRVMKHAEKCGFVRKSRAKQFRQPLPERPGMATPKQIKKIYALWKLLEGTYYDRRKFWKALRGFLRTRFLVEHENFLTFEHAHECIEALKAIGMREGAEVW